MWDHLTGRKRPLSRGTESFPAPFTFWPLRGRRKVTEPIKVAGRTLKTGVFSKVDVEIDIRRFVNPRMIRVPAGLNLNGLVAGGLFTGAAGSYDSIVHEIQRWAVKELVYGPDTFWGSNEYFLLPEESLAACRAKCGIDCEDGANLIQSLCRSAGVPRERIWCNAGYVELNGEQFGHGYVVYVADNGIPVVVDWCCLEDSHKAPAQKIPYRDNTPYLAPWFSWDDQECWVDLEMKITGKIRNVKAEG